MWGLMVISSIYLFNQQGSTHLLSSQGLNLQAKPLVQILQDKWFPDATKDYHPVQDTGLILP
jgi:hypothetical protein